MNDIYEQAFHDTPVREFHEAFDHPISVDPGAIPSLAQRELRVRMIAEELVELARAFGMQLKIDSTEDEDEAKCVLVRLGPAKVERHTDGESVVVDAYDPVEAADALGDLRYLIDGGNLICGFPGELVLAEIHRSNMSKLGADGKPVRRADGKSMKGPNYFKPDIKRVLGL